MKNTTLLIILFVAGKIYAANVVWNSMAISNQSIPLHPGTKLAHDGNNKIYYVGSVGSNYGKIYSIDITNPASPLTNCISDLYGSGVMLASQNSDLYYLSGRLFYTGGDGYLWSLWYNGSNWQNVKVNLANQVMSGTRFAADELNRLYFIAGNAKIYQVSYSGNLYFNSELPCTFQAGQHSALTYNAGWLFYLNQNDKVCAYHWDGEGAWNNIVLNAGAVNALSHTNLNVNQLGKLYYTGSDFKIYEFTNAGTWNSTLVSNQVVKPNSSPRLQPGTDKIVYTNSASNTISFLFWNGATYISHDLYANDLLNPTFNTHDNDILITHNGDIVYYNSSSNQLCLLTPTLSWKEVVLFSGLSANYYGSPVAENSITRKKKPVDYQFYYRQNNNQGVVDFEAGNLQGFTAITLKVEKTPHTGPVITTLYNFPVSTLGDFAASVNINAELSEYKFSYKLNGQSKYTAIADKVVCGDAYIISGQSNAAATANYSSSNSYLNNHPNYGPNSAIGKYSRCYGNSLTYTANDWQVISAASSWTDNQAGTIALRLQHLIQSNYQIPVCIINNAFGGSMIEDHQFKQPHTNPVNAFYFNYFHTVNLWRSENISGFLLRRIYEAGLENGIKNIIWYQGESNAGAGYTMGYYKTQFKKLYDELKYWIPNLNNVYLAQIHSLPYNQNTDLLSEDQRTIKTIFPNTNIRVVAANGIRYPNCEGYHYTDQGYEEMGDRFFNSIVIDNYNVPFSIANTSPDIIAANLDVTSLQLTLSFNQALDVLKSSNPVDIAAGIKLTNNATVSSPYISGNQFICTISSAVVGLSGPLKVSYLGMMACFNGLSSPGCNTSVNNSSYNYWCDSYLRNSNDMAALSFKDFPVNTCLDCARPLLTSVQKQADPDTEKLTIYPNPANIQFFIKTNIENASIKIVDVLGKTIYESKLDGKTEIETINMEEGVYFYSILQAEKVMKTGKLLVAH